MKTKGARLTTEISLPGRFLVYVPNGEGLGVSRRLEDAERDAAQGDRQGARPRRAAASSSARPPRAPRPRTSSATSSSSSGSGRRSRRRRRPPRRRRSSTRRPSCRCGSCATSSPATSSRAQIDDDRTHKRIVGYLKKTSPHMVERVHRYQEKEPLFEASGVDAGDPLDARPARRPPVRRLSRLRLRGGVHRHRRQHRPLRRLALARARRRAARGHDRQEQPRGREGGRAPAAAARHRRDHRHRLHRHGEPEEPADGRGGAAHGARARPHEDVRRRDLAARARRDDAPERHRRPARDPDAQCPTCAGDGIVVSDATHALEVERRCARSRRRRARASRRSRSPSTRGRSRSSRARAARGSRRSRRRRDGGSSSCPAETATSTLDHFEVLAEGKLETTSRRPRRSRRAPSSS